MAGFARDLRYAVRGITGNKAFTAVAVLTLALGIGANTAVFSVLHAVLLRPLPYAAPEQLAMLFSEVPTQGLREGRTAYGSVEEWRRYTQTFADIAVIDPVRPTLTTEAGSEQVRVARVSSNYFSLLGVRPAYGRTFTPEEAGARQRVSLISHQFWQDRFSGSRNAIGATLVIDGLPSRIIGILPPEMKLDDTEVWEPNTLFPNWDTLRKTRGAGSWFVIGRLRPGVTFEQAQAEMSTIARRLDQETASSEQRGISVVPMDVHVIGSTTRRALWMLSGAVTFVLLMAIANIAGLSLARSAGRSREISIRLALGATRTDIARQLIIESVTLAMIAGLAGLLVAVSGIRVILWIKPAGIARLEDVRLDPWEFGWTVAVSLLCGIVIGLAPAITTGRRSLKLSFEDGGRGSSAGRTTRGFRRSLVVAEFALAIILLVGAGLLVRSLVNVQRVDPGFRAQRVFVMQLASPVFPATEQRVVYFDRVLEQATTVGGVESAAIASEFFIGGNPEQTVTVEGSTRGGSERVRFRRDEVSPSFFATVGTPVIAGRSFSPTDGANGARVAIVNQSMADRLWPRLDPVGRRFRLGADDANSPWFTVVGVAGDMRRQGPEHDPIPQMFEPLRQNPSRLVTLLVRARNDPHQIMAEVQAAVRSVAKEAPVYGMATLEERLGVFSAERRFQTGLLIAFSLVALVLATIGIYGLMRYSVSTRTREIGVRIALGAQRGDILRMMLREGFSFTAFGLVLGVAGSLSLGRALSAFVFGVTALDPITFAAACALLTVVSLAACYFPARRAAAVDPISALKYQ